MIKTFFHFSIFFIILGFFTTIYGQERFVKPVDEGNKDKSFSIFRTKLIEAVKKRDKVFLLSILDKNIKNSFGGDGGIEEFKQDWKINKADSKLWNELLIVLNNGGTFSDRNTFAAPYSFNSFPEDLDIFEYQVIFGNNVNLRAEPSITARIVSQLSYNVVKVDYEKSVSDGKEDPNYLWLKVETLGGKKGFVSADFVRSPIAYRAIFEKIKGKWKMSAFIAGD